MNKTVLLILVCVGLAPPMGTPCCVISNGDTPLCCGPPCANMVAVAGLLRARVCCCCVFGRFVLLLPACSLLPLLYVTRSQRLQPVLWVKPLCVLLSKVAVCVVLGSAVLGMCHVRENGMGEVDGGEHLASKFCSCRFGNKLDKFDSIGNFFGFGKNEDFRPCLEIDLLTYLFGRFMFMKFAI